MFNTHKKYRLCLFLVLLASFKFAAASQQNYPFRIISLAESGAQIISAQNSGPAPILVTVNLHPSHAIIDRPSPIVMLVPPGKNDTVATIRGTAAGRKYRIAMDYKFSIGDPDALHNPGAYYFLPFQNGQMLSVGQALGGRITTHNNPSSKYAVDFNVPLGTPIMAARKGTVVDIDKDYSEGGADPLLKANHVLILHEDGTLGLYSHLTQNRIPVTLGQRVEAGELIGYSGNTGYSSGPHLHFVVLANTRTANGSALYRSLPVKFVNSASGSEIQLHQGDKLECRHSKTFAQPASTSP